MEKSLYGVNTYQALERTSNHIRAGKGEYDLLIATGDLSEDGHPRAYQHFHNLSDSIAESMIWFMGNHDNFSNIPDVWAKKYMQREWHARPWHAIFLDTTLPGKDEGSLGLPETARLDKFLKAYSNQHVLVFLHHQPVDVGARFIDDLGLQNKSVFWKIISGCQNIRGVIFGHVHQEYDQMKDGVRLLSTPSTAMQFKPNSVELDFDTPWHGYRTITLFPDGTLKTVVHRIGSGRD